MDQNEYTSPQPEQEAPRNFVPPVPEQPVTPPQSAAPSQSCTYYNSRPVHPESPYANSPYVMQRPVPPVPGHTSQPPHQPEIPVKQPKERKKGRFWKTALSAVLTVALVAGGCFITAREINAYWSNRLDQEKQTMQQQFETELQQIRDQLSALPGISAPASSSGTPVSSDPNALTPSQVYARNVGSVVAISNQSTTNFFGQVSETASSGSGFILTEDGYIVSNYHVVSGASKLTVILSDGTEYEAQLIGGDENNDIALLKVEAMGLQPVIIGSSDALVVGDQVVAIGNPLGELTSTQTVGYISAKDRDITTDGITINMMQTDAAINPGNSGGPLFNMKGEVVGITTAKYSGTTNSGASIEGIGFAIPIDDVMGMLSDLKEHGYVTGAYLGVSVRSMDPEVAKAYGLPTGAQVVTADPGSCAQKAGIQEMDIIVKLGEHEISDINDLLRALRKFKPGDTTTIQVWRAGAYKDLTITLDAKPAPAK